MNYYENERAALEYLRAEYEKDGYEYLGGPTSTDLPTGFGSYKPDAIFLRDGKSIAIEVKQKRIPKIERQLLLLKEKIEEDRNWEFHVFYIDETQTPKGPRVQTNKTISDILNQVEILIDDGKIEAAFVLGWASFEAASRRVYKSIFEKPQTPGRLVTVLAEKGLVSPDGASQLRVLLQKRNTFIHGGLDAKITATDAIFLMETVKRLQKQSGPPCS